MISKKVFHENKVKHFFRYFFRGAMLCVLISVQVLRPKMLVEINQIRSKTLEFLWNSLEFLEKIGRTNLKFRFLADNKILHPINTMLCLISVDNNIYKFFIILWHSKCDNKIKQVQTLLEAHAWQQKYQALRAPCWNKRYSK